MTIIPKGIDPENLSQCRNLSCTTLFSKLLEAYILDELKKETSFADSQYGGIKGLGVDHFLVQTWDEVLLDLKTRKRASP